jgi:hypothetical protein
MRFVLLGLMLFVTLTFHLCANSSPFYLGVGLNNILPTGEFKKLNQSSLGFNFQLQNRSYCNLWYGIRIDYAALDSASRTLAGTHVFSEYLLVSPELRYVFLLSPKKSLDDVFYLFLNGLVNISSITRKQTTNESNFGLGGSIGGGIGFCFNLFHLCWTLEFNGLFSAPNFILRSESRPSLTNFNFGVTLGVRL